VVPTGFSPNNDGENDQLLVHGKEGTRVERFQVYDRWGELVFQREDFAVNDPAGWDGLFRGQDAPTGVYIWYMEVQYPDESEEVLRGQTALIR
jgi:gliding motility-associated-like protein